MGDVWYYAEDDKTVGPLSLSELTAALNSRRGARDVLVWKADFADWKPAGSVAELANHLTEPPPPPVAAPPAPPQPSAINKATKVLIGPVCFIAAFFIFKYGAMWMQNEAVGLTGDTRSAFVNNAVSSCNQRQLAAPENRGASPQLIASYCNCFANGMADRISINQIKAVGPAPSPSQVEQALKPVIDAAAATCAEEIAKK